ncbi:MAG: hypothetical protein E7401_01180 [Ruminococcaceae bacterium]|nr:hypothetical protein [Oscillospiraceae bacterium]
MGKAFAKLKTLLKGSKYTVAVVALCCAAVVLAGCFFAYAASYEKILPNVEVEGFGIGGMEKLDAAKELHTAFVAGESGKSVVFECDGNEKEVAFEELKIVIDENKTAEKAFEVGRQGGVFKKTARLLLAAFKKTEVPLEVSVDEAKLEELISELAAGKEIEPEPAGYSIDGKQLTLKKGHGGKKVDRQKALATVKKSVASGGAAKVSLVVEEIKAEKVDADKLYDELTAPAKNAEYKYEDGEVKVVDETVRVIVDKQKIKQALDSDTEGVTLTVETEAPEVTAAQLRGMLFRDTLGTYSSNFATSTAARASNVTLTAQRINGYILMPGDVFSYDKTIGRRTVANGFREAGVYVGNKVESGIGGGICQTSSTLYSAALYANLEIVSRTSHSLPVSYMPAGMDATIAEGYIDLKIRNNTEYPVKIVATVNGRKITCSILGVSVPGQTVELAHSTVSTSQPQTERTVDEAIPKGYKQIINKGAPGYTVASNRIVKMNGEVVKTEKLTRSVYRAAPVEEVVNPADKETPTENLKIYTPGMKIPEPVEEPEPQPEVNDAPAEEVVTPPTEPEPEVSAEPEPEVQPEIPEQAEQTVTE